MIELSVVLPCLNEAETLATCITKARASMEALGVDGEVVVADNGSTDGSQEIAEGLGAGVVDVPERGYGAALSGGIAAAGPLRDHGRRRRQLRLRRPRSVRRGAAGGADLVMGNRFPAASSPARCRAAPLPRQPGAVRRRPAVLPAPDRRLPLRAARLPPRRASWARPDDGGHGVRQRDGRQGVASPARRSARCRPP